MSGTRERHAAQQRAYWHRNRERINAARREGNPTARPWTSEGHVAATFAFGANRRATRQGILGRLKATEVRSVIGPCVYCGAADPRGWDHFLPMALGGPNEAWNLVPACWPCNRAKGRKPPHEFDAWMTGPRRGDLVALMRRLAGYLVTLGEREVSMGSVQQSCADAMGINPGLSAREAWVAIGGDPAALDEADEVAA